MYISKEQIAKIKETINMIQQFMKIPEIYKLQKLDYDLYHAKLKEIFPSFVENYSSLFELVIKGSDLSVLDYMFNTMQKISSGSVDQENEEKKLGDYLAEKYVKSKI